MPLKRYSKGKATRDQRSEPGSQGAPLFRWNTRNGAEAPSATEPRASVVECACLFWRFSMRRYLHVHAPVTPSCNPKAAEGQPHSTTLARDSQYLSILLRESFPICRGPLDTAHSAL